jgi:hypothetical protein
MEKRPERNERKQSKDTPTASAVLNDGSIVEITFRPEERRTFLVIYSAGRWTVQDKIDAGPGTRFVPFSPNNNLIKNEVVLLPSEPQISATKSSSLRKYRLSFTTMLLNNNQFQSALITLSATRGQPTVASGSSGRLLVGAVQGKVMRLSHNPNRWPTFAHRILGYAWPSTVAEAP